MQIWKKIEKINYENINALLESFKKKNIKTSPWIDNIFRKNNYSFKGIKLPIELIRISLKELGFTGPTELQEVYKASSNKGLNLVEPEIALVCREFYLEQPTGEWLRFATPFKSIFNKRANCFNCLFHYNKFCWFYNWNIHHFRRWLDSW